MSIATRSVRNSTIPRAVLPWVLAAALAVVAAVLWGLADLTHVPRTWSTPWFAVVVVGYVIASDPRSALRFELRRHGVSLALTDVPMVVGLFLLPAWCVLVASLLGCLATFATHRGPAQRAVFNASTTALNVAVSGSLFFGLGVRSIEHPQSWLITYAAVLVGSLACCAAVLCVITLVQGKPDRKSVSSVFGFGLLASGLNATFALVVLLVLHMQAWAAILILIITVVFVMAYRGYTRSVDERKSLSELYDFTRAVGTAHQDTSLADVVLEQTRGFLRAEHATLWLPGRDGFAPTGLRAGVDDGVTVLTTAEPDLTRAQVIEQGRTLMWSRNAGTTDDPEPISDVIATPLWSGETVVGVLEVSNRLGENAGFGRDDVRLLETLAAHAGVAVQNSRLLNRLRHDASHDALTGLPNRLEFVASIQRALTAKGEPGEVVAVLLLDLDSFKDVNDTLGHVAGDRLLKEVGQRLSQAVPAGALVARMGGDEFAVLLRLPGAASAHEQGIALQDALVEPVDIDGLFLDAGGSVGVAVYPDHAIDAVTLLQRAEVAMYAAKEAVRQVQSYVPTMDSLSVRRLSLVSALRRAIDEEQLTIFYQPKVNLADQEFVGVEVLVRWQHPEQGLILPDDFVPIAEHTGMIGALTAYVLESALRQCRAWLDQGRQLHVAVNISVRSLLDADFPDRVERLLTECGVPPSMLTLEITESGVMSDVDRALPTLIRLRDAGVRLSVDDFGTGHSSLMYLRRLPVCEVKIDKSFVLNMATDPDDRAIVRTIIDLGRNLGLSIVAEGVESDISYTLLREMGCDLVQGFLLSRPVPYERLEAWICARTEIAATLTGARRLRVVNG